MPNIEILPFLEIKEISLRIFVSSIMFTNKTILFFLFLAFFIGNTSCASAETHDSNSALSLKGYISNKKILPIKLRIMKIDEQSFYLSEDSLEDNSVTPYINLMINAELPEDYSLNYSGIVVFIPKGTKFEGHISEITREKNFNRKGFFKVKIDKISCSGSKPIALKSSLTSKSETVSYRPIGQIGKTTAGLLSGAITGALLSYKLGGIGLIAATNGYSLAGAAAAGGLVGSVIGFASKGKSAKIEPGDHLEIFPVDEVGLGELQKISCPTINPELAKNTNPSNIKIDIISVKKRKNDFGETAFKLTLKVENNSSQSYKISNFILKDSQGKEYFPSLIESEDDVFSGFPANETKTSSIDYDIEYPRAKHWLILKDKSFNKTIGKWEIAEAK